jgi:hypothetical protein
MLSSTLTEIGERVFKTQKQRRETSRAAPGSHPETSAALLQKIIARYLILK